MLGIGILLRLVFNAPQLDRPVSLPFIRRDQMNHKVFVSKLEDTLQSHENIGLDKTVDFNVIHIAMPEGGGGRRKGEGVQEEVLIKQRPSVQQKECYSNAKQWQYVLFKGNRPFRNYTMGSRDVTVQLTLIVSTVRAWCMMCVHGRAIVSVCLIVLDLHLSFLLIVLKCFESFWP